VVDELLDEILMLVAPAVAEAGDPAQARRRAPAGDPDRRPGPLRRPRLEHHLAGGVELALEPGGVALEQGPQHLHGLVEAGPPLQEPMPAAT
jgi:hypothetical protein